MSKKNNAPASNEDRKAREQQTTDYHKADWAYVLKMTSRGGGSPVMMKRGK